MLLMFLLDEDNDRVENSRFSSEAEFWGFCFFLFFEKWVEIVFNDNCGNQLIKDRCEKQVI